MSTTFKKGWYLGKPLRELLPNTKSLKFWYLGKPFPLFDKPAVPSVPITAQPECLHLTLAKYSPTIFWGHSVTVSTIQSLILLVLDPVIRSGLVEGSNVLGSGVEVLYDPSPRIDIFGSGTEVLYAPTITGYVSQVFPQVEYVETFVRVDQAGIAVVAEAIPSVQIDQAGIAVISNQDGCFLVNIQHLTLSLFTPTIIAIEMLELDLQSLILTLHAPYVYISYSIIALPAIKHLTFSQKSPSVHQGCAVVASLVSLNLSIRNPAIFMGAMISAPLDAVLTIFSPTIRTSSRIAVSKCALVLTLKAPTINHNAVVSISNLLSLTLGV
jgi:hypothetical protein